jgi:hypothetical protein
VESASDYYEANFRLFEDYLSRPNNAARYAAAFAILHWISDGSILPTRFPHLAGLASVLGNIYKSSSSSRRPIMDLLRKYLENKFHIRPEKKGHFQFQPAKNIDLSAIPSELSSLVVQVYFDIPFETNREETVTIAFRRSLSAETRFALSKEICGQIMAELVAERSFQNLFSRAIRAYDGGKYLWLEPTQIDLNL